MSRCVGHRTIADGTRVSRWSRSRVTSRRGTPPGKARSAPDFNDLEQYALRVVDDESAVGELRAVRAVFIDEYQDINPVQSASSPR